MKGLAFTRFDMSYKKYIELIKLMSPKEEVDYRSKVLKEEDELIAITKKEGDSFEV